MIGRASASGRTEDRHAGVAESAAASGLSENLSARQKTGDAELLKFGESVKWQSRARPGPTICSRRESAETNRAAPAAKATVMG